MRGLTCRFPGRIKAGACRGYWRNELITSGLYSLVKHPLYTGVALHVVPWIGFLLNTWLGAVIGTIMYIGARMFSPQEEEMLSKTAGAAWNEYCNKVKIPWL